MANRTVAVALKAEIGQYVAGMSKASAATMRLGESAKGSQEQASKSFDLAGKGALIMGGAIVAGLGMAISASMKFESSMSAVQAATHASASTMDDLRAAALQAGADTAYSATEAADAITEMSKAGVSAKDIMGGGLKGALSLAAAGQLDVADAAGIAATAMQQFGLAGQDLPHVADLLAAGAGKAMGSVEDLSVALKYVGPVAAGMGVSIEETTGTLALFASQGILSDQAGTSLRGMLSALTSPSKQASQEMESLGINVFDAQGNFVGLDGVAGQLHDSLSGLTEAQRSQALGLIFGNEQVTAARVLYKGGSEAVQEWTNKVNDSGYAAETAAAMQDNLRGDLEKLGGSWETLMINLGSGAQGPLREIVQVFTEVLNAASGLIDVVGSIPGPVQLAAGAFAAFKLLDMTGVLGGINRAASPMRGTFSAFGEALGYARQNGDGLVTVMGSVGSTAADAAKGGLARFARAIGPELGLAAATYLVTDIVQSFKDLSSVGDEAHDNVEELLGSLKGMDSAGRLDATNKGISDLNDQLAQAKATAEALDSQNWFNKFVWTNPFSDSEAKDAAAARSAVEEYEAALKLLEGQQRNTEASTSALQQKYGITTDSVMTLADKYHIDLSQGLDAVLQGFANTGAAAEIASGGIVSVGNAAGMTDQQIEDAADALEKWIEQLQTVGASFVEPLDVYKGLLDEKNEAEKTAAQATADATDNAADSWEDYVGDVSVSLGEFASQLEQQIANQENWRANLVAISQRGGSEVAGILATMGVAGADITQQMADATAEDFNRMKDDLIRDAQLGGEGAAGELDQAMKVMAAVGAAGAGATVQGIAAQLGIGVGQVAAIAAQYGVTLADGINPVLASLGKTRIVPGTSTVAGYGHFASGGYTGDGGKYTPAGIVHKGEFVMPQEAVNRIGLGTLGAMAGLPGYAGGGFVSAADVPRPSSTAPYGAPISTAGDATMGTEYDAATAWIQDNAFSSVPGPGGSVERWRPVVLQALAMLGQSASLANGVLSLIASESGGNPNAINLTDSNAKAGHPSRGLMQTIPTTFAANRSPALPNNIVDPLANIYAGIHYALARYGPGMLAAGGRHSSGKYIGYETGTDYVPETGLALLHKGEAVIPAKINAQSREFSGGVSGSGGDRSANVSVQARVFIGDREITDIVRVESEAIVGDTLAQIMVRGAGNP